MLVSDLTIGKIAQLSNVNPFAVTVFNPVHVVTFQVLYAANMKFHMHTIATSVPTRGAYADETYSSFTVKGLKTNASFSGNCMYKTDSEQQMIAYLVIAVHFKKIFSAFLQ